MEASARQHGSAQGSLFWALYQVGQGADDPYSVTQADTSTWAIIEQDVSPQGSVPGSGSSSGCSHGRRAGRDQWALVDRGYRDRLPPRPAGQAGLFRI